MKSEAKSITKITQPKVLGTYHRPRLYQLLDQNRHYPVIWVSGPAGSGKTTLLSSYLKERRLLSLWYQVDEGDADLATFFYYLGLAVPKGSGRRKNPLPLFTPEYSQGLSTFSRRYFENLYGRLKASALVVLDNYHEVPEISAFHGVIRQGLTVIPEGINVIVISREPPPSCMARLLAGNKMKIISWPDIRFTIEETEGILTSFIKRPALLQMVKRFHEKLQGWVAGLILLAKRLENEEINYLGTDRFDLQYVFDYFAGEIFEKTNQSIQDFFLRTAFISHLNPTLCTELTGLTNAGDILDELTQKNYFVTKHSTHVEQAYQYHPLFQEFLQARASKVLPPEDLKCLKLKSAELLEKFNQVEDAVRLYTEGGHWESLVRLILHQAPALLIKGRHFMLAQWLESVPPYFLEHLPWPNYWLGLCRLPYDPAQARDYFNKAFEIFKLSDDPAGLYLSWCAIVDTFLYAWDNFISLDHWIVEFNTVKSQYPIFPSKEIEIRTVAGILTALLLRKPDKAELTIWRRRAKDLLQEGIDDIGLQMTLMNPLILYHLWIKDYAEIKSLSYAFQKKLPADESIPFASIFLKSCMSMYLWLSTHFEESFQSINKGLELANKTGIIQWNILLFTHAAHCALSNADLQTGADYLTIISGVVSPSRRLDLCHYHLIAAWESLLRGDRRQALEHAELTMKLGLETGSPWPIAINRLCLAEVLFECGHYQEVFQHLAEAQKTMRKAGSQNLSFKVWLLKSYFAFQLGKKKAGRRYLIGLMKKGREQRWFNTFLWRQDVMANLCMQALELGIEVDYVNDLIRTRKLFSEKIPPSMMSWPYPLRIHTLGTFELIKDDKPIVFSKKVQQRPLIMLQALIACGGERVSHSRLTEALWPDSEGDLATISFETTLHRLRRLLGNEKIIKLQGGQLSLDKKFCWVDIWAFECLFQQTESLWRQTRQPAMSQSKQDDQPHTNVTEEAVHLTEKAISIYTGHFLPETSSQPWAVPQREDLRYKFLQLVIRLGKYWEGLGQWDEAVESYQRGLEVDNLSEELYQSLMICYHRLGKQAAVAAVYYRCQTLLRASLGMEPTPQTEALYKNCCLKKY